jgi:hypothetical protein
MQMSRFGEKSSWIPKHTRVSGFKVAISKMKQAFALVDSFAAACGQTALQMGFGHDLAVPDPAQPACKSFRRLWAGPQVAQACPIIILRTYGDLKQGVLAVIPSP